MSEAKRARSHKQNAELMPPKRRATGAQAVMNQRSDPTLSLDDFPTPPWATRALARIVLPALGYSIKGKRVLEPAAGRGIMSAVLADEGAQVVTSDIMQYADGARLDLVGSFVGEGLDVVAVGDDFDAVITNPPFAIGLQFAQRALRVSREAVAFLCRSNWAEGVRRYEGLFRDQPPTAIAQFVERVPMTAGGYFTVGSGERVPAERGGYDPNATTATAYSWFVWILNAPKVRHPALIFIPPCRTTLEAADDAARFGKVAPAWLADQGEHFSTIKGSDA